VYVFPPPVNEPPFRLVPPEPPVPRKPRRRRKPPVSLSGEQLLALLATAKAQHHRDWVLILVTYWHGLRASEAVNLTAEDFEAGCVRVQRGKGSDVTLQPLQEHENPLLNEKAALEDWLANRTSHGVKGNAKPGSRRALYKTAHSMYFVQKRASAQIPNADGREAASREGGEPSQRICNPQSTLQVGSPVPEKPAGGSKPLPDPSGAPLAPFPPPHTPPERLFPITRFRFWQLVHKYAVAAGIPPRKTHPHVLKHTIAKHLIREGLPINEVQAWLGWKSLETANWYLMADEEELGERVGNAIRSKMGLRQIQQQGFLFPK
jgi:site-specific recombinase XerD